MCPRVELRVTLYAVVVYLGEEVSAEVDPGQVSSDPVEGHRVESHNAVPEEGQSEKRHQASEGACLYGLDAVIAQVERHQGSENLHGFRRNLREKERHPSLSARAGEQQFGLGPPTTNDKYSLRPTCTIRGKPCFYRSMYT